MTSTSSNPFSATPRPLAILVADDSLEMQQLIRRWLEELGHTVMCVSSGNAAVRVLRENPVDLVITEVIMANGDGLEVILEMRKQQPAARAIAITAGGRYLPPADCLRVAKGLGAHETLMKPLRHRELIAAVERVFGATTSSVAPTAA